MFIAGVPMWRDRLIHRKSPRRLLKVLPDRYVFLERFAWYEVCGGQEENPHLPCRPVLHFFELGFLVLHFSFSFAFPFLHFSLRSYNLMQRRRQLIYVLVSISIIIIEIPGRSSTTNRGRKRVNLTV